MFRGRLRLIVLLWLTTQLAAMAAAPFALCRDHDHGTSAAHAEHACCRKAGDRARCPHHGRAAARVHDLDHEHSVAPHDERAQDAAAGPSTPAAEHGHHHTAGTATSEGAPLQPSGVDPVQPAESTPVMGCVCHASEIALAALTIGSGPLPAAFVLPYDPMVSSGHTRQQTTTGRTELPDIPPPRG